MFDLPPEALSLESPAWGEADGHDVFGLPLVQLSARPARLRFSRPPLRAERARPLLRLVNARDCRRTARIEVCLKGALVGSADVRIPAPWASWGVDLSEALGDDPTDWPEVLEVEITALETSVGLEDSVLPDNLLPALQISPLPLGEGPGGRDFAPSSAWVTVPLGAQVNPRARSLGDFLHTRGALDYLGWMIGCTTTGLWDLYAVTGNPRFLESLERILAGVGEGLPLETGNLSDPSYLGSTRAEVLNSRLESFAPVAALAKIQRHAPTPDREAVLRRMAERMLEVVRTPRDFLTTEGCFTLAFPLAAIAKTLGESGWFDLAARECLERWGFLVRGDRIVQRAYPDGRTHVVNWARGTAWLVLGTAQTLRELPPSHRAELVSRLEQITPLLLERQRSDGLWNVFTDRPDSGPETSGSAGIAAGLAIGAREGWLSSEARAAAERCLEGLERYLEPDGCLAGVSQHNPAGEEALQLGYRIRAAWGTGLYAQLVAALTS